MCFSTLISHWGQMQVPSRTYKEEKMISCDNMYPYMNNIKQWKKPPKVVSSHLHTACSKHIVHLLSVILKSDRNYYNSKRWLLEKVLFTVRRETFSSNTSQVICRLKHMSDLAFFMGKLRFYYFHYQLKNPTLIKKKPMLVWIKNAYFASLEDNIIQLFCSDTHFWNRSVSFIKHWINEIHLIRSFINPTTSYYYLQVKVFWWSSFLGFFSQFQLFPLFQDSKTFYHPKTVLIKI